MIIVVLAVMELIALLGLSVLRNHKNITYKPHIGLKLSAAQWQSANRIATNSETYITLHADRGWTIKPKGKTSLYQANAQGLRAEKIYSAKPPQGKVRVAAFGDSFVHGDEVMNDQTWQNHLESHNTSLEVLNFGVSAYGLDQAYWRYQQEGKEYNPDIVIIGFMSENPGRAVNVFRPFYEPLSQLSMSKARYRKEGEKLIKIPNPLPTREDYQNLIRDPNSILKRMSKDDFYFQYWYAPHPLDFLAMTRLTRVIQTLPMLTVNPVYKNLSYNPESEVFQINMEILSRFYNEVRNDGAIPLIVIFCNSSDILRLREHGFRNYQTFLDEFKRNDWNYLDLTELMLNDKHNKLFGPLFMPGNHTSDLGNQRIADYIMDYLVEQNWFGGVKKSGDSPEPPLKI